MLPSPLKELVTPAELSGFFAATQVFLIGIFMFWLKITDLSLLYESSLFLSIFWIVRCLRE